MTNEQKEKIIELRKLGIGYLNIAMAMDVYRDKVRNFWKAQELDGYGKKKVKNKSGDAQTVTEIFVSKNAVLFYAEERW